MSDSPFAIELEPLKQMAVKFMRRIDDPTVSDAAVEAAKTTFALHYLNFRGNDLDVRQAECVFQIAMRKYLLTDRARLRCC